MEFVLIAVTSAGLDSDVQGNVRVGFAGRDAPKLL